ncbi:hypothetical protein FBU30_000561, partial [Linnemannia zychae]
MTSYEGLRKLTLGDKPVIIKYGDLITIQDDADISHAISLSNILKLTINDKVTHPVVIPMESLAAKLNGLNEKQTIAAVTAALVDLQEKIGKTLQVIQAQHPTSIFPSDNSSSQGQGINGQIKAIATQSNIADSKPVVLTAEALDQLLEPRKSLLTRQGSVSSQTSSLQATRSPPLKAQGAIQPSLSNVSNYLSQPQQSQQPQQQQQQQQLLPSQLWSPHPIPVPNGVAHPHNAPDTTQQHQHLQQQQPQQQQPLQQTVGRLAQPQPQLQSQLQQPQQQQQSYNQYGSGNVSQQQVHQTQQQQPQHQYQQVPQQLQHQQQPISQQPYAQNQVQGQRPAQVTSYVQQQAP